MCIPVLRGRPSAKSRISVTADGVAGGLLTVLRISGTISALPRWAAGTTLIESASARDRDLWANVSDDRKNEHSRALTLLVVISAFALVLHLVSR